MTINKRRDFLKQVAGIGTASAIAPVVSNANHSPGRTQLPKGFTLLFQGDSITDGNRTRNNDWNHIMGHGYQYLVASNFWCDHPSLECKIYNRGISGNKVTDLAARWQQDTLDLQPDLLSILIGINDISAFINGDQKFAASEYEQEYRLLLHTTKDALPNIQFVLCDPFVLPVGKIAAKWDVFAAEVAKRQQVVKQLAKEFNAIHVPFQDAFNRATKEAAAAYWIWDGVHPMPAGHALMAREWAQKVSERFTIFK